MSKCTTVAVLLACLAVCCLAVSTRAEEAFAAVGDGLVRGVSHDSRDAKLAVLLDGGDVVTYQGVTPSLFREFMNYSSQDEFYRQVIVPHHSELDRRSLSAAILTDASGSSERLVFGGLCAAVVPRVRLGVDLWHSEGKAYWTTQFGGVDPDLGPVDGSSKLTWNDSDSDCAVLNGEIMVTPHLRISGRYGFGTIDDATTVDADHLSVPSYYVYDLFASEQRAESDGDTRFYDANLHLVISSFFKPGTLKARIDIFAGYASYKDEFDLTSGRQTVINYAPVTAPFPEPLNSTYDFEWQGVRVGVATVIPVSSCVDLSASVALLENVEYDGAGFWNLRDDLRDTPPSFVHESGSGSGFDAEVVLSYQPWQNAGFRLGYRALEWKTSDGRDTVWLADGSQSSAILDKVRSERTGVFLGVYGQL